MSNITLERAKQLAQEMFILSEFDSFDVNQIIEVLVWADHQYFNEGETFIEDSEYDALKQYTHGVNPTHPYFLGTGSEIRGGKVKLPYPMGSLTQVYQGDTSKWIAQNSLSKDNIVVSDKLDGVSALVIYDQNAKLQIGFSRGDGIEGADITRHLRKMPSLPQEVRSKTGFVVRGEIIVKKTIFPIIREATKSRSGGAYKNPRNMVAGLMNSSENPDVVYQYLDFVAYEIIKGGDSEHKALQLDELVIKHGFLVPGWQQYRGDELTDHVLTERLVERRNESPYELDGLVLDVASGVRRQQLTPSKETLNPEYARKYKVADESNLAIATVKGVEWNISKDGYFKPRVNIEPVELVGVTVQYATGFNAKFINDNKIGKGAQIKITRSGDVIPFILGVVKPAKEADMPVNRDVEWTETGVDLKLVNASSNATVRFEQLLDFFNTIDVPALKEGNLKSIFDAGFETPESVIELTQEDISTLVGSRPIGKKIFAGLREKLTNIPMYQLMGAHPAFGRGVGVRKMKKLYEAFEGEMTRCEKVADIMAVEGFEHKTATKIVNGMPTFTTFLMRVHSFIKIQKYEAPKTGNLSGMTFVFTGFRNSDLEKEILNRGGKMGSAVSKNTTYLVADDPTSTSGKAAKARECGVRIINVTQLRELL